MRRRPDSFLDVLDKLYALQRAMREKGYLGATVDLHVPAVGNPAIWLNTHDGDALKQHGMTKVAIVRERTFAEVYDEACRLVEQMAPHDTLLMKPWFTGV